MSWLVIAVGGAIGAVARHALQVVVHRAAMGAPFPTGIFLVNVLGSAAIGLLAGGLASSRWTLSTDARLFLVVGILGGFTTFSSFTLDTLTLIRGGQTWLAAANVIGQTTVSLLAAMIGFRLAS